MSKIMIIEDDYEILNGLKELLELKGYQVETARTVAEFQKTIEADLYLLDITLPDGDGFHVCAQIRKTSEAPVIFITSCDDQDSVVKGLDMGGDDYITKPFYTKELLSRIQANLRRVMKLQGQKQEMKSEASQKINDKWSDSENGSVNPKETNANIYRKGELTVYLDEFRILRGAKELYLTNSEFLLLSILIANRGLLLKRGVLLEKIWDSSGNYVENNTLTVLMSRLKSKLGTYGSAHQSYIETIRNVGYRWKED